MAAADKLLLQQKRWTLGGGGHMTNRECTRCGSEIPTAATACPSCLARPPVVVSLPLIKTRATPTPMSVTQSGSNLETGEASVRVHDPAGASSQARRTADGRVTLDVRGAANVGKGNEGRVAKTLAQRLAQDGTPVELRPGVDQRGEDHILCVGDRAFVLQITIAPSAPDFWRDASLSSARTDVPEPHAASWIREAIERKGAVLSKVQRGSTILAVDVRHAGVLALPQLLAEYLRIYGDPKGEFGFASVWVVGPTAGECQRLGVGVP